MLLGPIVGLVLDGYQVKNELQRPLLIAAIIAAGRFLVTLAMHTDRQAALERFNARRRQPGVLVVSASESDRQRWWLLAIVAISLTLPFLASKYWLTVLIQAMIYVLLGLGLNIVVGTGRSARSRLRRLLRRGRVRPGPGRAVSRPGLLERTAAGGDAGGAVRRRTRFPGAGCTATIWPSSPWALAKSSAWC
ncbi:MAG: hypothetical protein R3F36_04855 [Candidatus Competibacteraceae bacterium]